MIPVVLVMSERQRIPVNRLIDYCQKLDGTQIEVIEFGPETTDKYTAQHLAIRKSCEAFKGQTFFWIEPDAIPLFSGWKYELTQQYLAFKHPFMLPNVLGLDRTDAASGIGFYPANAIDIIPEKKPTFPILAWDHWLYKKKSELIAFTRLIQHSYGVHENGKLVRRHSFPEDKAIIRPNALIFHSDPLQTLLPAPKRENALGPTLVAPYQ